MHDKEAVLDIDMEESKMNEIEEIEESSSDEENYTTFY
jgi:hypothetical protein